MNQPLPSKAETTSPAEIGSICVYCASSDGSNPAITQATVALGELMAEAGIELVYGGGAVGLMGLIADTVMGKGGRVTGIIPSGLFPREVAHSGISDLIEVDSMHTRKMMMFDRSDAFIALPGGFGTLEELAEVTTWAQVGIHNKPIGVLNVDGFFDLLLGWFDRCISDQVLKQENRALIVSEENPAAMLRSLQNYDAPYERKWLGLDES